MTTARSSHIELAEIELDLFNRLLKTGVIRANPSIKTLHEKKKVLLDGGSTVKFQNGILFANYMLVLKQVLAKVNQDLGISGDIGSNLKEQNNA